MSDETNSPMDPLLREHAKRRREQPGAPTTLHPANRRVLQAEVRAVRGGDPARSAASPASAPWWFRWPGLVGFGTAVLMFCFATLWWSESRRESEVRFAKADKNELSVLEETAPPASSVPPPAAPKPTISAMTAASSDGRGEASAKDSAAALELRPPAAPMPLSVSPEAARKLARVEDVVASAPEVSNRQLADPALSSKAKSSVDGFSQRDAGVRSRAAGAVSTPRSSLATNRADSPLDSLSRAAVTLQFKQVENPVLADVGLSEKDSKAPVATALEKKLDLKGGGTSAVMDQFELSYSDGQAQIVDRDGSIYRGYLLPVSPSPEEPRLGSTVARKESERELLQGNALNSPIVEAGNYRLHVTGTNRSLQERILVEGNLRNNTVANSNLPGLQNASQRYVFSWQLNSTVYVGRAQSLQINAQQVLTNAPSGQPPTQR